MSRKIALAFGLLAASQLAGAAVNLSQIPLFVSESVPPLNMLVMGRDHKLYYEAYNDASDLNDDGVIDVGYKGYLSKEQGGIDYYGYFNSYACYSYADGLFTPVSKTVTKTCSGQWSGDYLNYLATSRMDALRKVLYGGYRNVDTENRTVLQAVYIPQDAHTWGKEYQSLAHDGYRISSYTPLSQPVSGYRHLFAVVSLTQDTGIPQLRTLTNTTFRIWNWVSKERPVAGDDCDGGACTSRGPSDGWGIVPSDALSNMEISIWKDSRPSPNSKGEMDTLFSTYSPANQRCGTGPFNATTINTASNFINPFTTGPCSAVPQDHYHTLITGRIEVPENGTYEFSVDGDDAVDFLINTTGAGKALVASYYGGHGRGGRGGMGTTGSVYLEAGRTYEFSFRHEEDGGDANFALYWKSAGTGTSTMTNRNIRVLACPDNADLRESNCVAYGSHFKPTGILHDYGSSDKMFFGLLSGSYQKNMTGGVLRSKLQSFSREYKNSTGQFCSSGNDICDSNGNANGIVSTINKFRITDFNYSSYAYGCGWIPTRPMTQSDTCYMWGNPIGEMMYETMRYFAGATGPTTSYDYTHTGSRDAALGLGKIDTWVAPYASTTNPNSDRFPTCSVPVMTVISDINPSYDFKLPGSHWDTTFSGASNPASIRGLNVSTEADAIWSAEGGGSKSVFIGESNDVADSAPTAKTVTGFSKIRGLSPEEPSKQGTYYSAAVARFGATNKIGGDKSLLTYSVALASPLPTFKLSVGSGTVTVVPFAKSVSGDGISPTANFQPTNQIVDYYVEKIANTDASCSTTSPSTIKDCDRATNEGRPYVKFRINYEDVEQGADHDMDAIVLYELMVTAQNQLVINLSSEYAAGGIDQHMGYVISGTTKDGIYLDVKDQGGSNVAYKLDTPEGKWAGECAVSGSNCPALSRLSSSRTFAPSGAATAVQLESPLWYAAKYGTDATNPDVDGNGIPDNYFLVTNALKLKDQLNKAFSAIDQKNNSVTSPSVETPRDNSTSETDNNIAYIYRTVFDIKGWTGDLIKERVNSQTSTTLQWSAKASLPGTRKILMSNQETNSSLVPFTWSNLADKTFAGQSLRRSLILENETDAHGQARVNFIRGDSCTAAECSAFRTRTSKLGDIVNSSPVLVRGAQYLAYRAGSIDGGTAKYQSFQSSMESRTPVVYVGANDGMLHAFNADSGAELFAFIPTTVIPELYRLSASDYGKEEGSSPHKYYVDGTPVVSDVYYDGDWHTVLVGSLGAGGRAVFALDITNPESPKLLWEFSSQTDGDMGYSIPRPAIGRLHNGKWAALVPNGYNGNSGRSALFVIDIKTGELISKLAPNPDLPEPDSGLSSIRTADFNGDGIIDYAYAGDMQGNVWRFDLLKTGATSPFTAEASASDFKVSFGGKKPLYTAKETAAGTSKRQPITTAPALVRHPSGVGYLVIFGTGRYLGSTDKSSLDMQTIYGVWDRKTAGESTNTTPDLDRSNLQVQTMTSASFEGKTVRMISQNTIDWYGNGTGTSDSNVSTWGWYLDLKAGTSNSSTRGERVIYNMAVYGEGLIFSTVTPEPNSCAAGLTGFTYGINPTTGGRTLYNVFDMNGDGKVDADDSLAGEVISGHETPAGGAVISDGLQYHTDGSTVAIAGGGNASGRQTWRLIPANQSNKAGE